VETIFSFIFLSALGYGFFFTISEFRISMILSERLYHKDAIGAKNNEKTKLRGFVVFDHVSSYSALF